MAQDDYVVANGNGATVRADINNQLAAIKTSNSGNAAPSSPSAGQPWLDTDTPSSTNCNLSYYDGTDWIVALRFDFTNNWCRYPAGDGTAAAPALTFNSDDDTGFFRSTTNTIALSTGGTQRWTVNTTDVTSTLPRLGPLGSNTAPSYSFTGDANTGIYSSGADAVNITTGGTNRFQIDSSGAIQTGNASAATGYTTAGDITLPAARNIRAKNTFKAWVNFNGTGTVAIRDSFNVSSITDNGVGDYTINFTNALADANYAMVAATGDATTGNEPREVQFASSAAPSTSACRIVTIVSGVGAIDLVRVCCGFMGS